MHIIDIFLYTKSPRGRRSKTHKNKHTHTHTHTRTFTEISVILRIQSEYRKTRTRKNSVFGHFSCSDQNTKTTPYIVNFEQVSHILDVSIYDFEQVNSGWEAVIIPSCLLNISKKNSQENLHSRIDFTKIKKLQSTSSL